ncbi:type III pantothenate kinase [Rhodococcus hoagii]|nr:type III pantothenate kinase [Prescottella equi]
MLLTVDVRNTNIVSGCSPAAARTRSWCRTGGCAHDPRMTADELALKFRGLLGANAEQVTGCVGAVDRAVGAAGDPGDAGPLLGPRTARRVEPGVRTGVPLWSTTPRRSGPTESSTVLRRIILRRCVHRVDFGTSTCIDVVSAKGEFLGGAIAPGLEISTDALESQSAALRKVEPRNDPPRSVVGKNTVEANAVRRRVRIRRLVDGLVHEFARSYGIRWRGRRRHRDR